MTQKPAQPGFWMAALLTLMALIVQVVLSMHLTIVAEVFSRILHRPVAQVANEPIAVGFVNIIAFGVAIAVGLILGRVGWRRALPLGLPSLSQFASVVLAVLGGDILLSEVDNLFRSIATPPDWLMEAYKQILSSEGNLAGRIFLLVMVAPITEELLFRGVILHGLITRFPAWAAVCLAALLFAAGHVNPWQFFSAFGLGVALGWFYLRTRSVMICILAHAISNGLFVLFTSLSVDIPGLTSGPDLTKVSFQPWWLDLSGALLLLAGLLLFSKATPHRESPNPTEPPVIPLPLDQTPVGSEPPAVAPPFVSSTSESE